MKTKVLIYLLAAWPMLNSCCEPCATSPPTVYIPWGIKLLAVLGIVETVVLVLLFIISFGPFFDSDQRSKTSV